MRYTLLLFLISFSFFSSSAQVASQIHFSRDHNSDHQVISINWLENEINAWETENKDRLTNIALKTDLEAEALPKSGSVTSTFKFEMQRPYSIEVMLQSVSIAEGEFLSIKDGATGNSLYLVDNTSPRKILIPSFDPSTAYFEWSSPDGDYKSRFTIRTLYLHDVSGNRGPTIGFGTALSCQPNAACKQDSIIKLISNSAVRIRMVMDEGIGWCTGSFVNNTRNDKEPYLLTAYHCTFEYTPQYELWRFDLDYKSDSCANPASEPEKFSMTGCSRISGRQASDFLLVLLDQHIPSNIHATFAGWNRDAVVTPDTSYLIHHPNADIRKISVSTNKAVIHPNQIGWSEGYTTPADHHFRFKFTEGGHQPGSSGGPVFNQSGLMIGQHHGGTKGCEEVNNAFIGRFTKSWDEGTSAEERLKDWLDPEGSGPAQWPSLENLANSDLVDVYGTITDPSGNPVNNVTVLITGSITDTVTTNAEGQFFVNGINRNGEYHFMPKKNDFQTNGVNSLDLLAIQKHLLGIKEFDQSWQNIAGDATNNDAVSAGDILILLKLLLGKISFLATSPSWRFDPPAIDVNSIPPGQPLEIEMKGIKIGDVNGTANPGL